MSPKTRRRLATAIIAAGTLLTVGCSGSVPALPQPAAPRYQMQVVGNDVAFNLVYRIDTATGEIESFIVTSPGLIKAYSGQAAGLLKQFHESMTFTPGPTLGRKAK